MKTILMDGTKLKNKILLELKQEVLLLKKGNIIPHLCIVQVGNDPSSNIYIRHKEKVAKEIDIKFSHIKLKNTITFNELKKEVWKLNNDNDITGIIIQFPLPGDFKKEEVAKLVIPSKDADGINPINQSVIKENKNIFAPITCTPQGILELLKEYKIKVKNKKILVLGKSLIVGQPMADILRTKGAIVTSVDSKTNRDLVVLASKEADIIISATGSKDVITPDIVKEGSVIMDVGIFKDNGKLRGDTTYKNFLNKVKAITPVPGGVGPMTVIMLLKNVILLTKQKHK